MKKTDYEALFNSPYDRKELCWIILTCLDFIQELNERGKND